MANLAIDSEYIRELEGKFSNFQFRRVERKHGKYITDSMNRFLDNDIKIFKEIQVKRNLRSKLSIFVPKDVKKKLSYFSQKENKNEKNIYKFDKAQNLELEEYAIQNVGHSTQLIQVPGFNILTDPAFTDLNRLLYPAKTKSYPSPEELPAIDFILISHNHRDHVHCDSLFTLKRIHNKKRWPQPKVLVPKGDKELLRGYGFKVVIETEWYTKISADKDVNGTKKIIHFISVPVSHRSGRFYFDHHKSLVTAWVVNPEQEMVIFKFSGDTRSLISEDQKAVDAVIWHEIKNKPLNRDKENADIEIPDIICFEPSGPNYTRSYMDITHQSTSYSALLKFVEAENLAELSGKTSLNFLERIKTCMIHHNKFELGPDRFNEGLFVFKKLLLYLDLDEAAFDKETEKQKNKVYGLDHDALKRRLRFTARPIISALPLYTSLMIRSKGFIIDEIKNMQPTGMTRETVKEYLIRNTVFAKIGERLNNVQMFNSNVDVGSIQKYNTQSQ